MDMPSRYRAFLSYSHRDSDFAENFHRELEGWRADRGLVGRETANGPAPRTLRPIFRDRDDFAGGRSLSEATEEALKQSDFMIVLCSPDAAASLYVNEEIRLFKALGGTGRIIPVIVAGEPGGAAGQNCFPEALVRRVDADGRLTDDVDEPLAADARDQGDGPRRALAKVIAGLLGVPFDEIVRRAERAERRRQRIVAGVAIVFAALAAAAAGLAWLAENRRVEAERNYEAALNAADALVGGLAEELVRVEGVRLETTKLLLERGAGVYADLLTAVPDAPELKLRKAAALAVFAKAYSAKGDGAAAVAALEESQALMQAMIGAAPTPGQDLALAMVRSRLGAARFSLSDREGAIEALASSAAALAKFDAEAFEDADLAFEAAHATLFLARIRLQAGETDGVAAAEETASRIIGHWRAKTPDDVRWSAAEVNHLEFRAAQALLGGDGRAAVDFYARAIDLLREVVEQQPEAAAIRAMLAEVLYGQAGAFAAVEDAAGVAAARAERARLLAELAAADAENRTAGMRAAAQDVESGARALATAGADGSRADALARIRRGLAALDDAFAAAPGDLETGLARQAALGRAGWALTEAGLHAEALAPARVYREIAEAALAAQPQDRERLRTATAARALVGTALAGVKQTEAALQARLDQIEGESVLAAEDPARRQGLAGAHWEAGFLLWTAGRRAEALPHYERRAAILLELVAEAPSLAEGAREHGSDLAFAFLNIGELRVLTGDHAAGAAAFRRSHDIATASLAAAPDDRARLMDLAWAEARMAQTGDSPKDRWPRVAELLEAAARTEPLGDFEEELLTVAKIAAAAR